ncbi:SMP-30/gluconolactonase/LRE family protein [Salinibacterium sp. SWN1162]|uniref:SMP-30/gluconolactonase/LRE family protein n=1 Tax=Salinibacterium sp. SWN1162 TaxID=2792053 RepID=UPI0018CD9F4E|nr:SMP-30/gluconolactonase/LRE family protein [Salinibacterium sp. SWN1162]MBH0008086.1 SMP-30/gluconolactonase/LRE family protein [Salinibacterium sp. SWN1162]
MTSLVDHGIVAPNAELERLLTGYMFLEGPAWDADNDRLIFSDIPASVMYSWSPDSGVAVFRAPSDKANGNTFDSSGRLISCHHATSSVTRTESDGTIATIASHYEGFELNSPNDVIVGADGAIYFTDPSYGRLEYYGVARETQLDYRGLYRLGTDGVLSLLASDFDQPNGLCFTPDGALLVCDTERFHIRRFDVSQPDAVTGGEVWATVEGEGDGAPDGLKCDSRGNVYCTGPGGVHVFDASASWLGRIDVPEGCANFTFGGTDGATLFLTASTSLYSIRMALPSDGVSD